MAGFGVGTGVEAWKKSTARGEMQNGGVFCFYFVTKQTHINVDNVAETILTALFESC